MIHLFKNNAGKFEIAVVNNGKYIVGSRQGYNRKAGAIGAIASIMNSFNGNRTCVFQDDTFDTSKVFVLKYDKTIRELTNVKPKKKYAKQLVTGIEYIDTRPVNPAITDFR